MIELKEAKYKGVSFLFEASETTGGNRIIKFNYPNSPDQSIEQQGVAPRSFAMSIILPHDGYYEQRDALLRVLEDGKNGVLVHPTFGELTGVTNGKYTLNEQITQLGRGSLRVTFERDTGAGVPVPAAVLPAQVDQQAQTTVAQAATSLSAGYGASLRFPANITDAVQNVQSVADSLRAASRFAAPLANKAAQFTRQVDAFAASIGSLVQVPADLAETLRTTFESLNNLYETPAETLGAMALLLDFGSNDPVFPQNTAGRIERAQNRQLVRTTTRTMALAYSYSAAAQVVFPTTDALDAATSALEAAYARIIAERDAPNEAQEQLDRLRVQAQASFDVARVNTRAVVTINTPLMPLSTLVYSYYGSTDLVDDIAALNGVTQHAFVEGAIRILTE